MGQRLGRKWDENELTTQFRYIWTVDNGREGKVKEVRRSIRNGSEG